MFLENDVALLGQAIQGVTASYAKDQFELLDTTSEQELEDLTNLAAQVCETPLSIISLLSKNRRWFRTRIGLDILEIPASVTFCRHAIEGNKVFEVRDAANDPEFQNNPLVTNNPNIRFYAGAPLISSQGQALGTLCVIDTQPRILSEDQRIALEVLARQVVIQFELRYDRLEREKAQAQMALIQEQLLQLKEQIGQE